MQNFSTLTTLPKSLIDNLNSLGYRSMTPIQEMVLPIALEGKDLVARAKTGSGKTASFGIPIVDAIDTKKYNPQVLILSPTRELADQIAKELRRIARYRENLKILTLCGGTPLRPQVASLQRGAHILIGTPGRVQDHLSRESIHLKDIKTVVLDEADRMLDMGFYDEIKKIISNLPKDRQSMLFSATYPDNIKTLSQEILKDPKMIETDTIHKDSVIDEISFEVEDKDSTLLSILKSYKPQSSIIFCNTKADTIALSNYLQDRGFASLDLQGDLDQRERYETLLKFTNGSTKILVATDVASRGLDVKDISLVVNYDLPHDAETYTHRIGRTARAGNEGIAITLYTKKQSHKIEEIAPSTSLSHIDRLSIDKRFVIKAENSTICIDGGKKSKLRAGDILGALSKEIGIPSKHIGKIDIFERQSYVAIDNLSINSAFDGLRKGKIKGRKFRVWMI
jgi:ATP-independent RNA helicase DbpA